MEKCVCMNIAFIYPSILFIYIPHVMFNFEKIFYEYTEKRARDVYNSFFDEQDCRR